MTLPIPEERWALDCQNLGRSVHFFDQVTSTNDLASTYATTLPDAEGMVVVAGHQTSGRGQYGRVWSSQPGACLLASVILKPPPYLRRPVVLTAWAAIGIAEAIRQLTGKQTRIKWPNDLLLEEKKVCGILIEQLAHSQESIAIVGFGLNLNQSQTDFAQAALPQATSLALASGTWHDLRRSATTVVRALDTEYTRLLDGEIAPLEAAWKSRVGLLGRHLTAELNDGSLIPGRLRDMSFDGIELETGDGFTVLRPEQIRHLTAN